MAENQGCLIFLLKLFGINIAKSSSQDEELPYRVRDNFLSAAELSFFQVLKQAIKDQYVICPKVRLFDLLYVSASESKQSFVNKIDRKHVDFVLCDPQSMQPQLVIELDDSSHQRKSQKVTDEFKDAVFESSGLPLLRVVAKRSYSPIDLIQQIEQITSENRQIQNDQNSMTTETSVNAICPKCNVEMVERQAKKGAHKGKRFWACPNYPDCREIVPID